MSDQEWVTVVEPADQGVANATFNDWREANPAWGWLLKDTGIRIDIICGAQGGPHNRYRVRPQEMLNLRREDRTRTELQVFVGLQVSLVTTLMGYMPVGEWQPGFAEALSISRTNLPRTGELEVEGATWKYQFHGGGVEFWGTAPRRTIDCHIHLDRPDLFDAWRLERYFGSLGSKGVRLLESWAARQAPLSELMPNTVSQWETQGLIRSAYDGLYELGPACSRTPRDS